MTRLEDGQRAIKPGRAILAVIGLDRVLRRGPIKITEKEFADSIRFEPELYDLISDFLDGKRGKAPLPKYDHEEASALLSRTLDDEDAAENTVQFSGHPGGDDFLKASGDAITYLQTKIPRRARITFDVERPVKPSQSELITWRRYLGTVSDPRWAVRQLLAATLGRQHMEGLTVVWPDVLQAVRRAAEVGISDRREKNPKFQLDRRVARQLSVLLGKSDRPDGFTQELQRTFAKEAKENAQNESAKEPDDTRLQTTVQKVAEAV